MENNNLSNELILNNNASLREYYTQLLSMYNKSVKLLTALNESLTSNAAEIEVNVSDTDNASSVVRIPSFLYLENKLEELSSTISSFFNIPKDGEAWFTDNGLSYKLNLVRSNIAPIKPTINNTNNFIASLTDNNILKDLVLPKTFVKIPINGLPANISQLFVKKIVIPHSSTFLSLLDASYRDLNSKYSTISYDECKARLYNLVENVDYVEYDTVINLPLKKDYYTSAFKIENIIERWTSDNKINYKVQIDTLHYFNTEDSSIRYELKPGDIICLGNEMVTFTVKSILDNKIIHIEENVGYASLQPYSENSQMVFQIYVSDYSKFNYVQVPLEEDQYIIVFISTIWNNVRSVLSDGVLIDLNDIKMIDEFGSSILDKNGNQYTYLNYYKKFCNNLGDLIHGMSTCAFSQITNYTAKELETLLLSDSVKQCVNTTINSDLVKVVAINKHLTDDLSTEDVLNLHAQKNEINAKLQTCQSDIDQVYSTLLTTDFSQNVTVTQATLQEKINGLYTERTELQKQIIAIVDNINSKASTLSSSTSKTKYRIRGISNVSSLESFLKDDINGNINPYKNIDIIGIDIEYKYKTTSKDTATLTTINNSVFTDWNKQYSIDKERFLSFTPDGYTIEYKDYSNIVNTIKWNQIDIPINYGEDVVIRVRYKLSVGQPFITLYTPWSEEVLITFPTQFIENVELQSVLETNAQDTISAAFNKTLINEGFTAHIQNKVLSNEQTFFHMPENIYSGFNTAENNLISLKDKLTQMVNDIEKYKRYIDDTTNTSYEIYLNYDDNSVLLSPNSINKINIYNTDHLTNMFIRKDMNLVIKNTGNIRLNLYSIFPGNTDEHLITSDITLSSENKNNYERVPLYIGDVIDGQYFGQWIYFRSNNPFNKSDIYYNSVSQNAYDYAYALSNLEGNDDWDDVKVTGGFKDSMTNYLPVNNAQILLRFRNNSYISTYDYTSIKNGDTFKDFESKTNNSYNYIENLSHFDWFIYPEYINSNNIKSKTSNINSLANMYVGRYEDILGKVITGNSESNKITFLNKDTDFSNFKPLNINGQTTNVFVGACLFPNLISKAQIIAQNDANNTKYINAGESVSIPIVFEYYVTAESTSITKSLYFDLRPSLVTNPVHYMIEISGNYDYTTTGDVYTNVDDDIKII